MPRQSQLCHRTEPPKRKFRSAASARRSGKARYGREVEAHRCQCGRWHITRRGADPQLEQLAQAVLGRKAIAS